MPSPNAHETAIADTVVRLLSHFATADEPLIVRREIAIDWVEDLVEFTLSQVQWATREWRRTQSLRPTIAEIRKLATQAQHNDLKARALPEPQEIERDLWESPQHRHAAIKAQEERYRRAAAYRQGRLDEYDAIHHPDLLAKRGEQIAKTQHVSEAVSNALDDLGVTSQAAE